MATLLRLTGGRGAPSPAAIAAGAAPVAPAIVDVRNGNGAPGEASAALSCLVELGCTAGTTGSAAAQPATTVVYGPGAQQAAQQIAGRFNAAAPAASSAVPVGHVVVTLGENYALPSRQASSPAATESNSSSPADSGPAVKAGGVPCVN
ncbi:LytR C-terminal domain-containing protein [Streptomyces sp. NPDC056817]|uniref:LytR C-terminal domain-containing protein n=1 Tax=Streptomyces sp. NPDC056817 TaxID=3345950 RepID=UPI00368CBB1D